MMSSSRKLSSAAILRCVIAVMLACCSTTAVHADSSTCTTAQQTRMRGLWIWNSRDVLTNTTQQNSLASTAFTTGITDVFLYLTVSDYSTYYSQIRAFNALMNRYGIHVWGLEGYRGYFHDVYGPTNLYAAVDSMISFNGQVAANERFVGFQSDMEPQDGQGSFPTTFHNGLTDAQLSTSGGGVWYATQARDREMLMEDWLTIHKTIHDKLAVAGLRMAAAMPSWTENYYGAPVMATFNGVRNSVGKQMMNYVDEYIVMTYNTNPQNAASRAQAQAQYASTLPAGARPRVSAAVETHKGPGATVSYGDNSTKNSRQAVLADMAIIQSILGVNAAFSGVNIHDWEGWSMMAP